MKKHLIAIGMTLVLYFILIGYIYAITDINITSYYGYLLIILGLVLALYYQLKGISKPISKPEKGGLHSLKWSQFSWFSFFTLTIMGTIIFFLDSFLDLINYRIYYSYQDFLFNQSKLNVGSMSNFSTIIVDTLFILFCFYVLLVSIKRVKMGTEPPYAGKLTLFPLGKIELGVSSVNLINAISCLFFLFCLILGVSFLLLLMYFIILIPLFNYVIKYGKPY